MVITVIYGYVWKNRRFRPSSANLVADLIEDVQPNVILAKDENGEMDELNKQLQTILAISTPQKSLTKIPKMSPNPALISVADSGPNSSEKFKKCGTNPNIFHQKDEKKVPFRSLNPLTQKMGAKFDSKSPYEKSLKKTTLLPSIKHQPSSSQKPTGLKKQAPVQLSCSNDPKPNVKSNAASSDTKTQSQPVDFFKKCMREEILFHKQAITRFERYIKALEPKKEPPTRE